MVAAVTDLVMGLHFSGVNIPQLDSAIQTPAQEENVTERVEHYRRNNVRVRETRYLDLLKGDKSLSITTSG